jgi:hypothetical protein
MSMRWIEALGISWTDALGVVVAVIGFLRRQATKARSKRQRARQTRSGAIKPVDRCAVDGCWAHSSIGAYCLEHAASNVSLWRDR